MSFFSPIADAVGLMSVAHFVRRDGLAGRLPRQTHGLSRSKADP
jgi:hypothetical protein